MTVSFKRIGAICAGGALCVLIAYFSAQSFWLHRTAVAMPTPPEEPVMETGTISTNGWEFTITKVLDFGRRDVRHLQFSPRTRQIFVAFGDRKDDGIFQWDIDTGRLVRIFGMGKGFIPYDYAISPDGQLLIAERVSVDPAIGHVPEYETQIVDVRTGRVLHNLGDIGCWASWQDELRFSPDGRSVWLGARTLENWDSGVVFTLDGTPIQNGSKNDFPAPQNNYLWEVPISKSNLTNYGLFYRDHSGATNLITREPWWKNYATAKDGRLVLAATWHDDIILWDAETHQEIARQRITNHHNGAGHIVYDEARDRFLIADPSWRGINHLRALIVTKRPSRSPARRRTGLSSADSVLTKRLHPTAARAFRLEAQRGLCVLFAPPHASSAVVGEAQP